MTFDHEQKPATGQEHFRAAQYFLENLDRFESESICAYLAVISHALLALAAPSYGLHLPPRPEVQRWCPREECTRDGGHAVPWQCSDGPNVSHIMGDGK